MHAIHDALHIKIEGFVSDNGIALHGYNGVCVCARV